jgi:hypothetical protein
MAQDGGQWLSVVNTVMNFLAPNKAAQFLSSWETVSFSRIAILHYLSNKAFNIQGYLKIIEHFQKSITK